MSTWAKAACEAMTKALLSCPDGSPEDKASAVDSAYPFGERSNHPYKVWLRERKEFFAKHGLPRRGGSRSASDRANDLVAKMNERRHWK